MLIVWLDGERHDIDLDVLSVDARVVQIGSSTGKRWTVSWRELDERRRRAPTALRRATGHVVHAHAMELRQPGWRERDALKRIRVPRLERLLDAMKEGRRARVVALVVRFEDGEDVDLLCLGGLEDGEKCAIDPPRSHGVYDLVTLDTRRGPLRLLLTDA